MSPNYTTTGNRGVRGATQSSSSTSAYKTFSASAADEWTDADTAAGYHFKLVIAELAFGRFEILCGKHHTVFLQQFNHLLLQFGLAVSGNRFQSVV